MLDEVERRLDGPARRAVLAEAPRAEPGHRLPKHPLVHTLAVEPQRLHWACARSLDPDHVIFLGPAARSSAVGPELSKLLLRPGAGALLAEGSGASADELALCLALVLERVPSTASLRYLTAADEVELTNWDAEMYRQALARSHGH